MPGFDGTGPNGMGPMTGGGRGFCHPTRAGVRPHGFRFSNRAAYTYPSYGVHGFGYFTPTREKELEFLKSEAQALKDELKNLENEIEKLSVEKE